MLYALLLKPHANVRYRQSLQKLALIELQCMLDAWGMENANPEVRALAGEPFLMFEAGKIPAEAWSQLSRHSGICLAARLEGEGLIPLERSLISSLPEDLPQVLKYKGKTNADFTYLMLHCARAVSAFARSGQRLTVLDPMCGKGTTLFCALCEGMDAVGVETDAKALQEADQYLERALKWHRVKHKRVVKSSTLAGGGSAKLVEYEAAAEAQRLREGGAQHLKMLQGDAARVREMLRPASVHLIVSDLPYGVQHAPKESGGVSSLKKLLERVLPGCAAVLKDGGAAAFSFNLNTLRRQDVESAMEQAGLRPLKEKPYADFSHWVEQAVERDVVIAVKEEKSRIKA